MKITKNKLKQVIKEEVRKILEGNEIPFPTDRVSGKTYEGESEILNLPDPLQNMIKYFDLDKEREDKLRKLFHKLEGSTDEIFRKAGKMSSSVGKSAERVPLAIDALYSEYFETE